MIPTKKGEAIIAMEKVAYILPTCAPVKLIAKRYLDNCPYQAPQTTNCKNIMIISWMRVEFFMLAGCFESEGGNYGKNRYAEC